MSALRALQRSFIEIKKLNLKADWSGTTRKWCGFFCNFGWAWLKRREKDESQAERPRGCLRAQFEIWWSWSMTNSVDLQGRRRSHCWWVIQRTYFPSEGPPVRLLSRYLWQTEFWGTKARAASSQRNLLQICTGSCLLTFVLRSFPAIFPCWNSNSAQNLDKHTIPGCLLPRNPCHKLSAGWSNCSFSHHLALCVFGFF